MAEGFCYRLVFSVNIKNDSKDATGNDLTLENKVGTDVLLNDVSCKMSLGGITFHRKIYQPGEIEAEVGIESTGTDGSSLKVSDISALLLKRNVQLYLVNRDGSGNELGKQLLATNYYVYGLNPRQVRQPDGNMRLFVRLSIFSMDKLMTLDKYSKTYVVKKLGSGILGKESRKFGLDATHTVKVNHDCLCNLKYQQAVLVPQKGKDEEGNEISQNVLVNIPSEFIQPYLVQYNESFYDFLVRTANRCGEFLYFEDGQLVMGLHDKSEPLLINKYASVTYQQSSSNQKDVGLYARDSMKEGGQTGEVNYQRVVKNAAGFPKDLFPAEAPYHSELSSDEYFFPLYADKFTSLSREMGYEGNDAEVATSQIFPVLATAMSSTDGVEDFSSAIAADKAAKQTEGVAKVASTNKSGNEKYISKYDKTENGNGQQSVLFGSLNAEGWTTLRYYEDIHRYEEQLQRGIICIDMGKYFEAVKLGQKIRISEDGDLYIVIQIQMSGEETWSNDYDRYESDTDITNKTGGLSQKIFAIPLAEISVGGSSVKVPFPPVQPVPVVRSAEPQTAFVTANDDPKYQGRVRIVYPWQSEFKEQQELAVAEDELALALKQLAALKKLQAKEEKSLEQLNKELATLKKGKDSAIKEKEAIVQAVKKQIGDLQKSEKLKDEDLVKLQQYAKAVLAAQTSGMTPELQMVLAKLNETEMTVMQLMAAIEQYNAVIAQLKAMGKDDYTKYVETAEKAVTDQTAVVEATKKEVEKQEKTVEGKKQEVIDKAAIYKKKIVEISSPWIRVATPMATDGGGTFFKPMVGDEVLVNYEGGNIERPYVVGSLFSKNTLAPDEFINRTTGPNLHKEASIAIVSPNGHGITFKDPTNAEEFVASVYPAFGPIKNVVNLPLPNSKDLMGGIRIGDRFGLYSIDMSADKRSVSISSSLGNVKLDAYTGITITAPNGDVKIEGKNVSISAGNNLSLTSGNNIKKKTDCATTKKGKLEEKVDKTVDKVSEKAAEKVAPPLDVALFRTVLETFLKPIEGTMCIKSKRYLKLEAGPGNTIISKDRYKDWDLTKKQKLAKSQDFFKMMIERVSLIDARLNDFMVRHRALWLDAYSKKEAYQKAAALLFTNETVGDLIIKAYDLDPEKPWEGNEFKVDALKDAKLKKIRVEKGTIIKLRSDEDRKSEVLPPANALGAAVHALRSHIESFVTLFDDMDDVGSTYIDKSLKEAFSSLRYSVMTQAKADYGTDLKGFLKAAIPDDTFAKTKIVFKRKLAAAFVAKVAGHPDHQKDLHLKVNYKPEEVTDEKVTDNFVWGNFVSVIGSPTASPLLKSLADHIKENASKSLGLDEWKKIVGDREVWDDRKGGQILFSDDENSTVNFDRGALHVERGANSYNMDRLKQLLAGLRE